MKKSGGRTRIKSSTKFLGRNKGSVFKELKPRTLRNSASVDNLANDELFTEIKNTTNAKEERRDTPQFNGLVTKSVFSERKSAFSPVINNQNNPYASCGDSVKENKNLNAQSPKSAVKRSLENDFTKLN